MRDRLEVVTPESVTFTYEVAGIGSRFAALAIDTLLSVGSVSLLWLIGALVLAALQVPLEAALEAGPWVVGALIVLSFLLIWGYFPFFEMRWNGQTPGKRWLGLRVVRENGAPIGGWEALLRNLLRLVDFLPGAVPYGVGMVVMFLNPRWKRLGDYAAGTVVIREVQYRLSTASVEAGPESLPPPADLVLPPDALRRLRPEEMEMVRRFLERRAELPEQTRRELAARLAFPLAERLRLAPEQVAGERAEALLEHLWDRYRGGAAPRRTDGSPPADEEPGREA